MKTCSSFDGNMFLVIVNLLVNVGCLGRTYVISVGKLTGLVDLAARNNEFMFCSQSLKRHREMSRILAVAKLYFHLIALDVQIVCDKL